MFVDLSPVNAHMAHMSHEGEIKAVWAVASISLNPEPLARNPKPKTLHPKPGLGRAMDGLQSSHGSEEGARRDAHGQIAAWLHRSF